MKCTANELTPCEGPIKHGNTYEITIKPTDTVIITVKDEVFNIVTEMNPRGIEMLVSERGEKSHVIDWSIQNIKL